MENQEQEEKLLVAIQLLRDWKKKIVKIKRERDAILRLGSINFARDVRSSISRLKSRITKLDANLEKNIDEKGEIAFDNLINDVRDESFIKRQESIEEEQEQIQTQTQREGSPDSVDQPSEINFNYDRIENALDDDAVNYFIQKEDIKDALTFTENYFNKVENVIRQLVVKEKDELRIKLLEERSSEPMKDCHIVFKDGEMRTFRLRKERLRVYKELIEQFGEKEARIRYIEYLRSIDPDTFGYQNGLHPLSSDSEDHIEEGVNPTYYNEMKSLDDQNLIKEASSLVDKQENEEEMNLNKIEPLSPVLSLYGDETTIFRKPLSDQIRSTSQSKDDLHLIKRPISLNRYYERKSSYDLDEKEELRRAIPLLANFEIGQELREQYYNYIGNLKEARIKAIEEEDGGLDLSRFIKLPIEEQERHEVKWANKDSFHTHMQYRHFGYDKVGYFGKPDPPNLEEMLGKYAHQDPIIDRLKDFKVKDLTKELYNQPNFNDPDELERFPIQFENQTSLNILNELNLQNLDSSTSSEQIRAESRLRRLLSMGETFTPLYGPVPQNGTLASHGALATRLFSNSSRDTIMNFVNDLPAAKMILNYRLNNNQWLNQVAEPFEQCLNLNIDNKELVVETEDFDKEDELINFERSDSVLKIIKRNRVEKEGWNYEDYGDETTRQLKVKRI